MAGHSPRGRKLDIRRAAHTSRKRKRGKLFGPTLALRANVIASRVWYIPTPCSVNRDCRRDPPTRIYSSRGPAKRLNSAALRRTGFQPVKTRWNSVLPTRQSKRDVAPVPLNVSSTESKTDEDTSPPVSRYHRFRNPDPSLGQRVWLLAAPRFEEETDASAPPQALGPEQNHERFAEPDEGV